MIGDKSLQEGSKGDSGLTKCGTLIRCCRSASRDTNCGINVFFFFVCLFVCFFFVNLLHF